jgi:hypothetical protein
MNTFRTTAIVEDGNHLKLETSFENLKRRSQVDLIILIKQKKKTGSKSSKE